MKSHVHYEAAFEDYLRRRQIAYVAVDEGRKSIFRDVSLKSFDFVVYSAVGTNWLADVKGRRWTPRGERGRAGWQTWATQGDLDGLLRWQRVFGAGFRGMLLFAYWIDGAADPPAEIVHEFRERRYVFVAAPLDEYAASARVRSPKWGTVHLPMEAFRRLARPASELLRG
ncbi:MAG: HYExAFE family protein [Planctomycetia bacterium]|nr:MAG: HYExAFE family protein [Planctomycetia bacterium]